MAKLTRLERSQKAHSRLKTKHVYTPGIKGDILIRYHNNILNIQSAKKRVISKAERREVYNKVSERYTAKKAKNAKTYAHISNEYFKYGKYK